MINIKNHNGDITISQTVFAHIVGNVINNCFGVVGMASKNAAEGIVSLLKKENYEKGVRVVADDKGPLGSVLIGGPFGSHTGDQGAVRVLGQQAFDEVVGVIAVGGLAVV